MTVTDTDDQTSYWNHAKHLDYHFRQFDTPYRSTVSLADFMQQTLPRERKGWRGLDVCCGMGANVLYFQKRFADIEWSGLDFVAPLLETGRDFARRRGEAKFPTLVEGDAFNLRASVEPKSIHVVTSLQTILCMEDVELALDNLFDICAPGGWIFISSLFTDFLVDVSMRITEYRNSDFAAPVGPAIYNVLCLEKFKAGCLARGAKDVRAVDFNIDIDLPVPDHRVMGTYTVDLLSKKKLQVSGPVLMPWKFVAIQT